VRVDAIFTRQTEHGHQRVPAYFSTEVQDIDETQQLDLQAITTDLTTKTDHWNARGSGYILERITKFVICITQYRPLHGSSYLETPQWLKRKQCVINVKNTGDSLCFTWSVLSALYPCKHNPDRLSNYRSYLNTLNLSGLNFPMPVKDIPKFEKLNSDISVNVLARGDGEGYVPLYVSKERNRRHHINLFLIEGSDRSHHYVWIKNMSRLVYGRTKHDGASFVCNSCLHPFSSKDVLDRHVPSCARHPPQDVKYPDPDDPKERILKFNKQEARFRIPFYLVCDFESFLSPIEEQDVDAVKATNPIDEHKVCGFACYRVSKYADFQTDPVVYSGPNVMDKFYEHVLKESELISEILADDQDMDPLTNGQQIQHDRATTCGECGEPFTESNHKVRHHDHVTGQYLFPACNRRNLTLKMPNQKQKATQGHTMNKKVKLDSDAKKVFFYRSFFTT